MPSIQDRIEAAKALVAANKKKLAEHSLSIKIQTAEAKIAKLEADHAKQNADQKRRNDAHAKIILGAAVLLLSPTRFVRVMIELIAVLTARDREWIQKWCSGQGISLNQAEDASQYAPDSKSTNALEPNSKAIEDKGNEALSSTDLSGEHKIPRLPVSEGALEAINDLSSEGHKEPKAMSFLDPVGEALKRAISTWNEGEVASFAPEILKKAEADDQKILEEWFASPAKLLREGEGTKSPDLAAVPSATSA